MANNRMYLVCVECINREETEWEDCVFFLAKYSPTPGWYTALDNFEERLNEFLDKHKHMTMYGEYMGVVYESQFSQFAKDKREILNMISEKLDA